MSLFTEPEEQNKWVNHTAGESPWNSPLWVMNEWAQGYQWGERERAQQHTDSRSPKIDAHLDPCTILHRISSNGVGWPERALLRGSVNGLCGLNSEDALRSGGMDLWALPEGCTSGKCGRISSVSSSLWTRPTKTQLKGPHQRLNRCLAIQINIYRF